ncbi:LysM peptidoglycan-binding domain-containing protein [Estrella lausannensis]|uniref:LysM domain-containing protein n=1 Tax=Estrella lausannensis TaxID=483423 RepID=A0A0H5DQI1_9BACT|nr:LysM peptidoglycan-binding domain-containing protein [Estrella lausannensis]CRX38911.1 Conserved hypothetical protein [Estrella lausannensis]
MVNTSLKSKDVAAALLLCLFSFSTIPLQAASWNSREASKDSQSTASVRHELSNLQTEINVINERLRTQEDVIEALKRDLESAKKKNNEEAKGKIGSLDQKFSSQDSTIKGFAQDLKELKNHSNHHATSYQDTQARLKDLEKIVQAQNDSIEHLRSALTALMDGLKSPEPESDGNYVTYQVKSGDSLGLIASKNKLSIKRLKEINNLKNDVIFTGQKLKVPASN